MDVYIQQTMSSIALIKDVVFHSALELDHQQKAYLSLTFTESDSDIHVKDLEFKKVYDIFQ